MHDCEYATNWYLGSHVSRSHLFSVRVSNTVIIPAVWHRKDRANVGERLLYEPLLDPRYIVGYYPHTTVLMPSSILYAFHSIVHYSACGKITNHLV
jgi:hypothetical protein